MTFVILSFPHRNFTSTINFIKGTKRPVRGGNAGSLHASGISDESSSRYRIRAPGRLTGNIARSDFAS
jgi:hypothetical protein